MSSLLALDIATVIGFAAGVPGGNPIWGSYRPAPPGSDEGQVFLAAERWLTQKVAIICPTLIYAEDQYIAVGGDKKRGGGINIATVRRLYGLRAVCALVCARYEIRLRWVSAGTVQRFFLPNSGRMKRAEKKAATIRVCHDRGWNVETEDEADGVAVWVYGCHDILPALAGEASIGPLWRQEGANG